MKSEERHELKTNDLGQMAQQAQVFFQQHGSRLLFAVCGCLLVAAAAVYWVRSSSQAASAGWSQMSTASSAEDFANVADKYPTSSVAAWARLNAANRHLESGIRLAFTDRSAGESDLNAASKEFEQLLSGGDVPSAVRERALFGLARCRESQADESTGGAVEAYERLLNEFPESIYKELTKRRIDVLRTDGAKAFYAWFHKQNPKPPDLQTPRDGQPADGAGGEPESAGQASEDGAVDPTDAEASPAGGSDGPSLSDPAAPSDESSPTTGAEGEEGGGEGEEETTPATDPADGTPNSEPSPADGDAASRSDDSADSQ
jgi:hypothetical protein